MTDDKAIEAACEAYASATTKDGTHTWVINDQLRLRMRAALAAADKARAEGFDFAIAAPYDGDGLKLEAERAALVEALDAALMYVKAAPTPLAFDWQEKTVATIAGALALVRKVGDEP